MAAHRKRKTARMLVRHVQVRAKQRLGVSLTPADVEQICKDIRTHRAIFMGRQSSNITLWQITVRGQTMIAPYDKQRKTIKTVLFTEDEMEARNEKLV